MAEQPLNLDGRKVKKVVDSLRGDLLVLLDEMVGINSYSHNTEGVAQVAQLVGQALPAGVKLQKPSSSGQERVWIYRHGPSGKLPILLTGHLDTVFPPGVFDSGVVSQDFHLYGPGVADMKGGVAVILGALWALDSLGLLSEIPLCLVFNGDEEIGSPHSSAILDELARSCRLALVFECGGRDGAVVTSRRGLRRYRLEFQAQAGHAGNIYGLKESAVVELAQQILALEAMNDPKTQLSVNVGRVQGGTAANIIADRAEAELEIRFWDEAAGDRVEEQIRNLAPTPGQPGIKRRFFKLHGRPAMPRTDSTARLFQEVAQMAANIFLSLPEEARLGASDANILAAAGIPTLDGLGPIGEDDHSPRERISEASLYQRVELLVHLLWEFRAWSC